MPAFAGHDRDALRAVWREAWHKHLQHRPLEPLEAQLVDLILLHPEYRRVVAAADADLPGGSDGPAAADAFLHLGLHMAVREGAAADRPPGLRSAYRSALERAPSVHTAEHLLVDCLAETLWVARRDGVPPDEAAFLERLRSRLATDSPARQVDRPSSLLVPDDS